MHTLGQYKSFQQSARQAAEFAEKSARMWRKAEQKARDKIEQIEMRVLIEFEPACVGCTGVLDCQLDEFADCRYNPANRR